MKYKQIVFSGHAVRQMFRRRLEKDDVLAVIKRGQIIANYPDDNPYPSCLMLGLVNNRPVHVVLAIDKEEQIGIVVTAYVPDSDLWTEDFKARRIKK